MYLKTLELDFIPFGWNLIDKILRDISYIFLLLSKLQVKLPFLLLFQQAIIQILVSDYKIQIIY